MKINIVYFFCFLGGFSVAGCNPRKVWAGEYEYSNHKHSSRLEIQNNSTFIQTVRIVSTGVELKIEGKWNQVNSAVEFSPFMYSVDMNNGDILEEPVRTANAIGTIKRDVIIFNELSGFWFRKK